MVRMGLKLATCIGASMALSGCATIFGADFAARWSKPRATAAPQPVLAKYTDEGRRQLADGQTGAAIESFRMALLSGEPSAPAYNAMGVAYARLGMFENSQKLFSMAIEAAPDEAKYRDNLARLMVSPALAMRKDGDQAAAITTGPSAKPASQPPGAAATALATPGRLTRVSRNEFRIVTAPQLSPKAGRAATAMARLPRIVSRKPAPTGDTAAKPESTATGPVALENAKSPAAAAEK